MALIRDLLVPGLMGQQLPFLVLGELAGSGQLQACVSGCPGTLLSEVLVTFPGIQLCDLATGSLASRNYWVMSEAVLFLSNCLDRVLISSRYGGGRPAIN